MLTPIRIPDFFFTQIREAEERADRVFEAVIGIVTDNKDPNKLGRIKVRFPSLPGDDTSWWAPIASLGAGKDRGWWFLPEIEDEVLVVFEHGDINRPVVLGAIWNGKDIPPETNSGSNPRRLIVSRQKSKIIFDDDEGTITLEDGEGNGKIVLSKENKITLEAPSGGDVCIFAPQDTIKIVANEVDLGGDQNASLQCTQDIKIGGDAAVTLKGGTMTQVYGSSLAANPGGVQAPQAVTLEATEVKDPLTERATQRSATAAADAAAADTAEAGAGAGDTAADDAADAPEAPDGAGPPPARPPGRMPRLPPTWSRPAIGFSDMLKRSFKQLGELGVALRPPGEKPPEPPKDAPPAPVLTLAGPDHVEIRKEITIKAKVEPSTPGTFVWFDVTGAELSQGQELTFKGKKKSAADGDQPVECDFTSAADGKVYRAEHRITVDDKPTLMLPINLSFKTLPETQAWLGANPIEVRVDDKVTGMHAVIEGTSRVVVSFRIEPGEHTVVITSGPAKPPPGRAKLRVVHFSAKVKVKDDKPAKAVQSTRSDGKDVGPKDRPTDVGRVYSATLAVRHDKEKAGKDKPRKGTPGKR